MLKDDFKDIILAGLGAAAYTYEKAEKSIDDMVNKGKLTVNEGKELSEELKRNIKSKEEKYKPITKEDLASLLKDLNLATKDDLKNIETRLTALENKEPEK